MYYSEVTLRKDLKLLCISENKRYFELAYAMECDNEDFTGKVLKLFGTSYQYEVGISEFNPKDYKYFIDLDALAACDIRDREEEYNAKVKELEEFYKDKKIDGILKLRDHFT